MKLAVLSESPADAAAIRILVDGILGEPTEVVELEAVPHVRRGFDAVLRNMSRAILHLYYQTDADALAVVLDSDKTPVHQSEHDEPGKVDAKCRLCTLRKTLAEMEASLGIGPSQPGQLPGRNPIKVAIGLAVPQLEAWLLCGKERQVGEAAWLMGLKSWQFPYTGQQLKDKLYGPKRYTLAEETECMVREAQRLVAEKLRDLEEKWFPAGFGHFANGVRQWKGPAA